MHTHYVSQYLPEHQEDRQTNTHYAHTANGSGFVNEFYAGDTIARCLEEHYGR